jgi:hypothetical protein
MPYDWSVVIPEGKIHLHLLVIVIVDNSASTKTVKHRRESIGEQMCV